MTALPDVIHWGKLDLVAGPPKCDNSRIYRWGKKPGVRIEVRGYPASSAPSGRAYSVEIRLGSLKVSCKHTDVTKALSKSLDDLSEQIYVLDDYICKLRMKALGTL